MAEHSLWAADARHGTEVSFELPAKASSRKLAVRDYAAYVKSEVKSGRIEAREKYLDEKGPRSLQARRSSEGKAARRARGAPGAPVIFEGAIAKVHVNAGGAGRSRRARLRRRQSKT